MARKLSGAELDRMKTDFDAPPKTETKKRTGKGNPNGRPPSKNPRRNHLHIMLSDDDAAKLEEAARLLDTDKTKVIVKGINRIYDEAAAEAWKRTKKGDHGKA